MNQTTWIVGGGLMIVILAGVLYTISGTTAEKSIASTADNNGLTITRIDTASTSGENAVATIPTTMPEETTSNTKPIDGASQVAAVAAAPAVTNLVTLKTSMGNITLKLYENDAPKTTENFVKLASSGFYDGIKFHRVIKGFMIQGGDPLTKDDTLSARWGSGGPGYKFADEINPTSAIYQRGYKHGVLAMANSGPNTNGSQFFIMAADYPLPPQYVIFGEVVAGLDVVDAIDATKTDENDRPLTPVVIESAVVGK